MSRDGCAVCGAEKHPQAYTCARCKRILDRLETRRDASGAYADSIELQVFAHCSTHGTTAPFTASTGIVLVEDGSRWRDDRYLSFEHRTPATRASIVVTCALVNRMKTDLRAEVAEGNLHG